MSGWANVIFGYNRMPEVEGSICETDVLNSCDSVPMHFKLCRKNIGGLEEFFFPSRGC